MNSNFAPWQAKGRWYRLVLDYDSTKSTKLSVLNTDFPEHIGFNNSDIYLGNNNPWVVLNVVSEGVPTAPYYDNRYGTRNANTGYTYLGTPTPMSNWKSGHYTFTLYIFAYKNPIAPQAESEG